MRGSTQTLRTSLLILTLTIVLRAEALRAELARLAADVVLAPGLRDEGELTLILDFSHPGQPTLLRDLSDAGVPVSAYAAGASGQPAGWAACPVFVPWPNMTAGGVVAVPQDAIFKTGQQPFPNWKRARTVLVWASGDRLEAAVKMLEGTVRVCEQKIDLGVFHRSTRFVFLTEGLGDTKKIFRASAFRRHPSVAAIAKVANHSAASFSYNFYHETNRLPEILLGRFWTDKDDAHRAGTHGDIFTHQDTLGGRRLNMAIVPYAHFIQATYLADEMGGLPLQRFRDHWGFTIDMLRALQEKLDFKVSYYNAVPFFDYGSIGSDGTWTGPLGLIFRGLCDFVLDFALEYEKNQIMEAVPYNVQEFETFASPLPRPRANYLAIARPYSVVTWILIVASMMTVTVLLILLAWMERELLSTRIRPWGLAGDCFWQCFGILVGERMAQKLSSVRRSSLRWLVGAWMLSSMCMCFFYSSILKSHLTSLVLEPSLKSFAEIVDGPLPWKTPPMKMAHTPFQLDDVQEGKAVRINWLSILKARIKVRHTTSDGRQLIHLGSEPFLYSKYMAAMFHPQSPWIGRFGQQLSRISNAGLIHWWEEKAWRRMRAAAAQGTSPVRPRRVAGGCNNACPLELEHYTGAAIFYASVAFGSILCFVGEKVAGKKI